jgi:hypothetical protein
METIVGIILSTIIGYVSSLAANKRYRSWLYHAGMLLGVLTLAVFIYIGIFYVKSVFKVENDLVGRWVERYDEEGKSIYALAKFEYNTFSSDLEFKGMGYDKSGEMVGRWNTIESRFEAPVYSYLFVGESKNPSGKNQGHRDGVGSITFQENYRKGDGYFYSLRSDNKLRYFTLYKIVDKQAEKEAQENPDSFIQKLYNDENYFKQVISTP